MQPKHSRSFLLHAGHDDDDDGGGGGDEDDHRANVALGRWSFVSPVARQASVCMYVHVH